MPPGCARGWIARPVTPREQMNCAAVEDEKSLCQQTGQDQCRIGLENNMSGWEGSDGPARID